MRVVEITVEVLPDGRMDTANAAKYLGLSVKTLAEHRCYGTGPRFIKPGRIFYYRADLDAWLRGREAPVVRRRQGRRP